MATQKQKRAMKEMVENGRNKGEAMIRAGYSPNTAKAPTKLTESKGWKELLEEYLPDEELAKRHRQLLWKEDDKGLDTQAVKAGLDMAYKLKGSYEAEKHEITLPTPILGGIMNGDGNLKTGQQREDKKGE